MSKNQLEPSLVGLIESTSGNPYRRFPWLPTQEQQALLFADLQKLRANAVWSREDTSSWISLTRLAWDSRQLGVEAGKVDLFCANCTAEEENRLIEALRAAIEQSGLSYLVARIVQDDTSALNVLQHSGFQASGGLLNLVLSDLAVNTPISGEVTVRPATVDDEQTVRTLASQFFENRLLNESRLDTTRVRSLYGEWAANDLKGRVPFTLLATLQGQPAGFVSAGKTPISPLAATVSFVDLIVVDQRMRQKGIGRWLMLAAIEKMRDQDTSLIELNVADLNLPAIALYKRLGFKEQLRYIDLSHWSE